MVQGKYSFRTKKSTQFAEYHQSHPINSPSLRICRATILAAWEKKGRLSNHILCTRAAAKSHNTSSIIRTMLPLFRTAPTTFWGTNHFDLVWDRFELEKEALTCCPSNLDREGCVSSEPCPHVLGSKLLGFSVRPFWQWEKKGVSPCGT